MAELAALKERAFWRLYGWRGLTLSFGYSQKRLMESFQTPLKKVLRPTGGGILLHGWDISFAAAVPKGVFRSPLEFYSLVAQTCLEVLKRLNVKGVEISKNRGGSYRREKLCWLVPTFGELTVGGTKFLAAASRRFEDGSILLHGSIFISKNENLLKTSELKPLESFADNVITLSELKIKRKTFFDLFRKLLLKRLENL
jgi:lipoate-protein ligase A